MPLFYAPKVYRSNVAVSFTLKEMQRYEMTGENETAIIKLRKRKAGKNRSIDLLEKEELNKKIEVIEPYPQRKLEANGKFDKNNSSLLLMHVYSRKF